MTTMTKKRLDPVEEITIHVITEGERTRGWAHTHGMARHGKPELEMMVSPLFLVHFASDILNEVADYMLNAGKEVKHGEVMQLGSMTFRFVEAVPIPGEESHYTEERLRLQDVDLPFETFTQE